MSMEGNNTSTVDHEERIICTPTLKGTQFMSQFWAVTQEYFWNLPELLPEFRSVTDYCVLMTVQ